MVFFPRQYGFGSGSTANNAFDSKKCYDRQMIRGKEE
jgi:hypothetical protein